MFVCRNAPGETRSSSSPRRSRRNSSPRTPVGPAVPPLGPAMTVWRSTGGRGISAAAVTRRVWTWPVRRPSRTIRLRSSPAPAVVGGVQALGARPLADGVAGVVVGDGGEPAVVDVDDPVPAAAGVEAEDRVRRRVVRAGGAERVLELVAVAPLLDRGDDRLDLDVGERAEALEGLGDLRLLLGELTLVGEALPGGAGTGLAAVHAGVGDPVGAGLEQLDDGRLGPGLLRLADPGADAVAGQAAGDEDDEALGGAGDAAPALRERVDPEVELGAALRSGSGSAGALRRAPCRSCRGCSCAPCCSSRRSGPCGARACERPLRRLPICAAVSSS